MDPLPLPSLDTPAALVDLGRMEANLQRVVAYARQRGLRWRPHAKTHKVPELAARQFQAVERHAIAARGWEPQG
jgi:D-serine deaminase-like pyridoxal phosphate-dependent protein